MGIVQLVFDDYVHPEYSDDHVNVNCVLSWRRSDGADDDNVSIDFQNGWVFNSNAWGGRADVRERVLAALNRNSDGKLLQLGA